MRFTKMEGLGNDYVYVDCTKEAPRENLSELAIRLSDRHFGVGSDGLICIFPSQKADFRMVMYNADGSQGAMCGNGIRCVGRFVYEKGLTQKTTLQIETLSGVKLLHLSPIKNGVMSVTVDMGVPQVEPSCALTVGGQEVQVTPVSVGNPHAVCLLEDVKGFPITEIGPLLERHSRFPDGVNVEFVQVLAPDHLLIRVWERGSGETMACGTGACAAAAAAREHGLVGDEVTATLPGGDLKLCRSAETGHLSMTGPAVTVFEGELAEK